MPRNQLKTVPITVHTTPHVRAYLEQLVESGLYGKSAPEAAERLIARAIDDLIHKGDLTLKRGTPRAKGRDG